MRDTYYRRHSVIIVITNSCEKPMVSETYKPPVNKLLAYADCSKLNEWSNYIEEFGFTKEHIPDLIRARD